MRTIKTSAFKRVVERVLSDYETIEEMTQALSVNSDALADTWRKRLTPGGGQWCWFGRETLTEDQVDKFLTAANATHLWQVPPLAVKRRPVRCEDCKVELNSENYRPLDLFRPTRGASGKKVWNATTQKWVRRPAQGPKKRARRNGRRFRIYHLCRLCAANALRERAMSGAVSENGKKRALRTKERLAPKRGGRPRLMTDDQLRAAYTIYVQTKLSRREVAERVWKASGKGTWGGYQFAIDTGWKRLGLPLTRTKGEQIGISLHGTDGTLSKDWKVQCKARTRAGGRCTQWVRKITEETSSHPAEDGLCHSHAHMTKRSVIPA